MIPSAGNCKKNQPFHLELSAKIANLQQFIDFAANWARKQGLAAKRAHDIELVIEEALVNIMKYAYPESPGTVSLTAKPLSGGGLRFDIRDHGTAFNPMERADPDLQAGLMQRLVGGLGIFLIKTLSDDIFWQRQGGENRLTIIFS